MSHKGFSFKELEFLVAPFAHNFCWHTDNRRNAAWSYTKGFPNFGKPSCGGTQSKGMDFPEDPSSWFGRWVAVAGKSNLSR